MKEQLLLIYNPSSGRQTMTEKLGYVVESLGERWDVTVKPTLYEGHAEQVAAEAATQFDMVVAAGGDGTIHEVVNGLMNSRQRPVLGILPAGTANDIARSLSIPSDLMEACDFLKVSHPVQIELGKCASRYFVNFLGFGLISLVSNSVKQATKSRLGPLTYFLKSLQSLHNQSEFLVQIQTEEKLIETTCVMGYVASGRSLAGFELFPETGFGDDSFEVILIHDVTIANLLDAAASILRKAPIENRAVTRFRATSLNIRCTPLQFIDMDGEKGMQTPVDIRFIPESLSVVGNLT
ncbi:diacylglycerol kinase family protein [Alicyclobacillus sp. SO9]|uniref:diacylglycerol/lipid kinase family protein n=1 Tax=Alicyclobacillus sp. SO9 TaxID=2665646 RepID=UPI0018E8C888|nr:diacylglycerol kinase family protein [Alicyclobacillus sp. SO9]QQE78279.1 diacylglycerol kinase family lipid kinase [Alicyclobacillus sp. SO9]